MKFAEKPNPTIMIISTFGVMIPSYAMLYRVINPVEALTLVIPSCFLFLAAFIVKK